MSTSNAITRPSRETLEAMVAGDVFVPGDDGYDDARRAWDLVVDQRPAVVVFAEMFRLSLTCEDLISSSSTSSSTR